MDTDVSDLEKEIEKLNKISDIRPLEELLSIVSICRNEEDLLPRYFKSIKDNISDKIQIVIVDTGSTDKTIEIIKKHQETQNIKLVEAGNQFAVFLTKQESDRINKSARYPVTRKGDKYFSFAKARNFASDQVTTPWAFSLDICDVIIKCDPDGLARVLEAFLRSPKPVHNCSSTLLFGGFEYKIPTIQSTTKIYRIGKFPGTDYHLTRWHCGTHEYICGDGRPNAVARSGEIISGRIEESLLLHRHAQRQGVYHSYKVGMACALFLDKIENEFDRDRLTYYFGRELYYVWLNLTKSNASREEIDLITKAVEYHLEKTTRLKTGWVIERSSAAQIIGTMMSKPEEARKRFLQSIQICPFWRQPYLSMATVCRQEKDHVGAIGWLDQAMKIKRHPTAIFAESELNYTFGPGKEKTENLIDLAVIWIFANPSQDFHNEPHHIVDEYLTLENEYFDLISPYHRLTGYAVAYRSLWHRDFDKAVVYLTKCYLIEPTKFEKDFQLMQRIQKNEQSMEKAKS